MLINNKLQSHGGGNCTDLPRENGGHYYWLDLIRFMAAFAVMACHFRSAFFVEYSLLPEVDKNPVIAAFFSLTRLGFEAVLIFFVLSGFLVGGKSIQRMSSGTFKARDYAIDRFVRIMLPLVASMLLYLPICLCFDIPIVAKDWIASLLSLQGIVADGAFETLWSLSYEVWFYILFFAIGVIFAKKNNNRKLWFGLFVSGLCMLAFLRLGTTFLFTWVTAAIIFAEYRPDPDKSHSAATILSLVITLAIMVFLQIGSGSRAFEENSMFGDKLIRNILYIAIGFSFGTFLRLFISKKPRHTWSLKLNNAGTKLAAFSYTLYLTHVPVIRLLRGLGAPESEEISFASVALYVCWLGVAIFIAWVMYLLFERNTAKVKRYLKNRFLRRS